MPSESARCVLPVPEPPTSRTLPIPQENHLYADDGFALVKRGIGKVERIQFLDRRKPGLAEAVIAGAGLAFRNFGGKEAKQGFVRCAAGAAASSSTSSYTASIPGSLRSRRWEKIISRMVSPQEALIARAVGLWRKAQA